MDDELTVAGQVCFALYAASRAVTDVYRPVLDRLGLTYPQYLVLIALGEPAGPRTVGQLGATLHLDSGTLSPLLKRLEVAGLVTRHRRRDDERVVEVDLTDAGRALRARCAADVPARLAASTGLPAAELRQLRETLTRLTTTLHQPKE